MRVLLVYPDICSNSGRFQQGLGYLSSVLKKSGHEVYGFHLQEELSPNRFSNLVREFRPNLVGFSSTTHQHHYVQKYAPVIKEDLGIPVVCGGIHPTLCPEEALQDQNVDYVCIGEGEFPFLELVNALAAGKEPWEIPNLGFRQGGQIKLNPLRDLITDLDSLPFPDRDLFDYQAIIKGFKGAAEVMSGRGCPFSCTYCCNHTLLKMYRGKGKFLRMRSVERVLEEIKMLVKKYEISRLEFDDDTFTLFPRWVKNFCAQYRSSFDLPFGCNGRVETLNEEVLRALKEAGCDSIRIGIESGNEWLRKNVLKRKMSNEKIIKIFELCHDLGIPTSSFNMIGLPYENPEMIEDTLNLNKKVSPDSIQISIFYPYPHTELWETCVAENLLSGKEKDSYFDTGTTLNLPTLSEAQINQFYEKFRDLAFEKAVKRNRLTSIIYSFTKLALGNNPRRARLLINKLRGAH